MNIQANTTGSFADHGALLECVIDAFDRVVLHTNKEARAELRIWRSGIEKCWRRMRKVTLRHEVVGLDNPFDILAMDANSDTHDHLLRPLSYSTIDSEQIGSLEGFETEAAIFRD